MSLRDLLWGFQGLLFCCLLIVFILTFCILSDSMSLLYCICFVHLSLSLFRKQLSPSVPYLFCLSALSLFFEKNSLSLYPLFFVSVHSQSFWKKTLPLEPLFFCLSQCILSYFGKKSLSPYLLYWFKCITYV